MPVSSSLRSGTATGKIFRFAQVVDGAWVAKQDFRGFFRRIRYVSSTMTDLTDPRWIKFKGILFLLVGMLAVTLLLIDHPTLKDAALLAIAIWCFCRFYYFAFYVIEHYVDPGYRFSGLWSFACYLAKRRSRDKG
jgi:hypothetical protein